MKLFDVKCLNRLNLNSKQNFEIYENASCLSFIFNQPPTKRINFYFDHNFDVDEIVITDRFGQVVADLQNEKTNIYAKPFESKLIDNLHRDPNRFDDNIQMVINYINQK